MLVVKWKIPQTPLPTLDGSPPNQAPGVPVHRPNAASFAVAQR